MTNTPPSVRIDAGCSSSFPPRRAPSLAAERSVHVELLVLASVALGAAGQLLLKASLLLLAKPPIILAIRVDRAQMVCAAGILTGLCIYAVGTVFWIRAVSRASISYLYPLSAGSYALVALGGHALFGEVMPTWRWIGIAVISAGVAMLATGGERGAT